MEKHKLTILKVREYQCEGVLNLALLVAEYAYIGCEKGKSWDQVRREVVEKLVVTDVEPAQ